MMYNYIKGTYFIILYIIKKIYNWNNKNRFNEKIYIVVPDLNDDWILLAIANRIQKFAKNSTIVDINFDFKVESRYLLMHYSLLRILIIKGVSLGNISIWFTHLRSDLIENKLEYLFYFKRLRKILVSSKFQENLLFEHFGNLSSEVVIGGYNENEFKYIDSNERIQIGFCSSFYERKNPELIFQIILNLPNYNFILMGKNWKNWEKFDMMNKLINFQYIETDYNNYHKYYNKMKIFLSVSSVEGGPIPLLEAMSCGAYPIITRTGFAEDIISNLFENGKIIETDISIDNLINLISSKMESEINGYLIAESIKNHTWDNFSNEISKFL